MQTPLPTTFHPDYSATLLVIKDRVRSAHYQAFRSVNRELIQLYWDIGKIILERQEKLGWGKSIVEQLAKDLQSEFPGVSGFSSRNLWKMRLFYEQYHTHVKLPQLVAEIPWGHNSLILEKCKSDVKREFYVKMTIKESWSRTRLEEALLHKEYERWALQQTNFEDKLPSGLVAQAGYLVKDSYNLSFLNLQEEHLERELEDALIKNIISFLSEMGGDFCFVGRQYRLAIEDKEFFIDLLFFHRGLQSLIAVELKAEEFKFEHTGQIAGYLAALDHQVKKAHEHPSIGIIICRSKNRTVVEYALSNVKSPIGVATYRFNELPEKIAKYLPSEEEISKRLADI